MTSRTPTLIKLLFFICVFAGMSAARVASAQEAQTPDAPANRAVTSSGAITGRVVGEDGRPLADAAIYIYKPYARVLGPPRTAATNAEGVFRAANLEAGLYVVNANLPGFVMTPDASAEGGESRYYRPGDSVQITLTKGGVISGTVRDANNEPVIAATVRAMRVRDAAGRATSRAYSGPLVLRLTDDRGAYRLYGLLPGTYLVAVGGSQGFFMGFNAYESDAPTFFPSSTRDTAAEVTVRGGEELTGVDIRYRGERGHTVSGTIAGPVDAVSRYSTSIMLKQASGNGYEAMTFVASGQMAKPGFTFNGLPDGEYDLSAQQGSQSGESVASIPRRVTVKGADVTGVELVLAPLSSIAGSVTLEALSKQEGCEEERSATLIEALVNARRDEKPQPAQSPRSPFSFGGSVPTERGEFTIRNLAAGSYRLTMRLPVESWYVRSIVLPATATRPTPAPAAKAAPTKNAPATPSLLTLKTGERMTGVTINVAQDAAGLRGRVVSATGGAEAAAPLPANLKVYLVPAERERAEDVLRYGEAAASADGSFSFTNLAPGRYLLLARVVPENESVERDTRPLFWDASERAKLRREAEAAASAQELRPCQRVNDFVLRFTAAASPATP